MKKGEQKGPNLTHLRENKTWMKLTFFSPSEVLKCSKPSKPCISGLFQVVCVAG